MNELDINRLEDLNIRYSQANMTGFKIVTGNSSKNTVLRHLRCDLKILESCCVEIKHVYRITIRNDSIDIGAMDNETPVSYFFTGDAKFSPKSMASEIRDICTEFDVDFENFTR